MLMFLAKFEYIFLIHLKAILQFYLEGSLDTIYWYIKYLFQPFPSWIVTLGSTHYD